MSDSPTPDLSLREKAERATRGPWSATEDFPLWGMLACTGSTENKKQYVQHADAYNLKPDGAKADAEFIAACSPDVILALLSRVERAEADTFAAAADFIVTGFQRGERADVHAVADSLRTRRKPAPTRYVCECGHTHADHVRPHDHSCLIMGCSCREYRLATPEVPHV